MNRIVALYLDFAELQALDKRLMYMKDWLAKLDDFLKLSGKDLLTHAGTISAETARFKAHSEYDRFSERMQHDLSDVEIHFIDLFEQTQRKIKQ